MKRFLIIFILLLSCIIAKAQSDTIIVHKPIIFETEQVVSKTNNTYIKYYVFYEGKYYESNKTSMERYYQILRFGGTPCVVLITSGKTKKQKIIVL